MCQWAMRKLCQLTPALRKLCQWTPAFRKLIEWTLVYLENYVNGHILC